MAFVALLHRRCRSSTRQFVLLLEARWHLPIQGGSGLALDQVVATALAPVYDDVQQAVQGQAVANVEGNAVAGTGLEPLPWGAGTLGATLFQVARRDCAAFEALLGTPVGDIGGSDRCQAYAHLPTLKRQLWWAHLQRDVQHYPAYNEPMMESTSCALRGACG